MYTASRGAGERSASAAAWRAPQHDSRRSSSASALVALAALLLVLGARASHSRASCAGHTECPLGEHCDGSGRCRSCSAITPSRCDAVDAECCSAEFRAQCPSNPGGCLSADGDTNCVNITSKCNPSTAGAWPPDHSTLGRGCGSDWSTGSGIACGEQCTATCVVGWRNGYTTKSIFRCTEDTSKHDKVALSGSLKCEQQTCALPSENLLHSTGNCQASLGFNESCTATCEEGWTAGKTEETFVCTSDSGGEVKLSGSLTCKRKRSSPAASPEPASGIASRAICV